jgi:hypothetical protein
MSRLTSPPKPTAGWPTCGSRTRRASRRSPLWAGSTRSRRRSWRPTRCGRRGDPTPIEASVSRGRFGARGGGAVGAGVAWWSGPGVTVPKCRCSGFSRPRWIEESSLVVLPGPLSAATEIDLALAPDGVADATLQGAQRLLLRLPLGDLALVVDPARGVVADLGDGGQVKRVVQVSGCRAGCAGDGFGAGWRRRWGRCRCRTRTGPGLGTGPGHQRGPG